MKTAPTAVGGYTLSDGHAVTVPKSKMLWQD